MVIYITFIRNFFTKYNEFGC